MIGKSIENEVNVISVLLDLRLYLYLIFYFSIIAFYMSSIDRIL